MRFIYSFLGYLYAQKQDFAKALKWFRKAADKGDAFAQGWLGLIYSGWGVKPNHAEAEKWYRMAADRGDLAAQANLGEMYVSKKDFAKAYFWRKLSKQRLKGLDSDLEKKKQEWVDQHLTPEQRAALDQRISDWKPVK